jgi:hypothetical protein
MQELLKQKISSQEGRDTNKEWGVAEKEEYQEDLSKKMEQGKSSLVSSAGNQVTLHEIVDRNDTAIKAPLAPIQGHHVVTNQ